MAADDPLIWYAGIGAKYLDLVGDYAGKEKFFIEGDSLLSECFNDPQLDFSPGFQQLHAVYSVEKYLTNLKKRGCTFDIVFFEDHASLCIPPSSKRGPRYFLVRSTVITHLKTQAQDTQVLNFKSLDDSHFRDYLHESACYFALCSDGASYQYSKQKSLHLHDHASSHGHNQSSEAHILNLRTAIWKLMNQNNIDVALLNGLTWQDSKVFAFVLERNSKSKSTASIPAPSTNGSPVESLTQFSINDRSNNGKDISYAKDLIRAAELPESSRLVVTISTLLAILPCQHRKFVLPHILHVLCLDLLPLSARALPVVNFTSKFDKEVCDYIDTFCNFAKAYVEASNKTCDSTIIDLVDGRLFRIILHNVGTVEQQLPVNLTTAVGSLVASMGNSSEVPGSSGSIQHNLPIPDNVTDYDAVLPFSHPAFDDHLKSIHVKVDGGEQQVSGRLALDLTHWHNSKLLHQPKTIKPRLEPREEVKERRAHQRFIDGLTRYAESLTDSFGKGLDPKLIQLDPAVKKPATLSSIKGIGGHPGQSNKPKKHKANASKPLKPGKLAQKPAAIKENKIVEKTLTPNALIEGLTHDGPHLERSMDAQEDSRVSLQARWLAGQGSGRD